MNSVDIFDREEYFNKYKDDIIEKIILEDKLKAEEKKQKQKDYYKKNREKRIAYGKAYRKNKK